MAAMGVLGLMCRLRVPMCRLTSPAMCRPTLERRALPGCCGGGEGCAEQRARTEPRCRDEGGLAPSARGAPTEVTGAERAMRRLFNMAGAQDVGRRAAWGVREMGICGIPKG